MRIGYCGLSCFLTLATLGAPTWAQEVGQQLKEMENLAASFAALRPGTGRDELLRLRPLARPDFLSDGRSDRPSPEDARTFLEVQPNDPVLGLKFSAQYQFGEGGLDFARFSWGGDRKTVQMLFSEFFRMYKKEFGQTFEKQVVKETQKDLRERLRPAVIWRQADVTISMKYSRSSDAGRKGDPSDWITVYVSGRGEGMVETFPLASVSAEEKEKCFQEIGVDLDAQNSNP